VRIADKIVFQKEMRQALAEMPKEVGYQ